MKVFISWSGSKSHKVALIFRDWLPSVIQSIVPYVSSEDIDKGARWSTDIAKELENSTFGILCVTKDNINAPWLSFEAGALSKTMDKSFVTPFLFDIRRSEVNGPMLQFQSTIFEKEDIRKMVKSLNKASGEHAIPANRLEKTFEVWYPRLEDEFKTLKSIHDEADEPKRQETNRAHQAAMIEEILELSRNNQKLLRNPEPKTDGGIEELKKMMQAVIIRMEQSPEPEVKRSLRPLPPAFFHELLHMERKKNRQFGLEIALSFFRTDFPWIYDLGKELIAHLRSNCPREAKAEAVRSFKEMVEISLGHPLMREFYEGHEEGVAYFKNLHHPMIRYLDNTLARLAEPATP
jgi:TIR domain